MDFDVNEALQILRRTPAVLTALLANLPDRWVMSNEGADTWSPFEIVGHLIHGEDTDWIPRAVVILTKGETRAFEPFDRNAQFERFKGQSLAALLDTFDRLRRSNLSTLERWALTPADLMKRGRHPDLGTVTLGQLLATWTAHDLSHLAQLARVMCRQYTEAVGPWRTYLRPLQQSGGPAGA